jgi:hypothetical protein
MEPLDDTLGSSMLRSLYSGRFMYSAGSGGATLFPHATNNNVAKANNDFFITYVFIVHISED